MTEYAMKKRRLCVLLLALLILATVILIFLQSAKSAEVSSADSEGALAFLLSIFGEETPIGIFLTSYVRKIAHFTEYAILGAEVIALLTVANGAYSDKRRRRAAVLVSGFAFALIIGSIDEVIQIFSQRGPSFLDVCLDTLGFMFSYSIIYYATMIKRRFCKR